MPGSRVTDSDSLLMRVATERTIWPVLASCTVWPSTTVQMCRSCGSGISSAVTTKGPVGVKPSNDLQRDHWASENWMLRAVTSLTTV